MNRNIISPNLIVSEVLRRWPETVQIFVQHRMACVGCTMSDYETVSSAAEIYGLVLDDFLKELKEVVEVVTPPEKTAT